MHNACYETLCKNQLDTYSCLFFGALLMLSVNILILGFLKVLWGDDTCFFVGEDLSELWLIISCLYFELNLLTEIY